jgi:membrane protease YdiL (CAAX protease family)
VKTLETEDAEARSFKMNYAPLMLITAALASWYVFGVPADILRFELWHAPIGFAAAIAAITFMGIADQLLPSRWNDDASEYASSNIGDGKLLKNVFIGSVAGVSEEIFFRGSLQALLSPVLGAIPAIALTNVMFGLAHYRGGVGQVVSSGLIGCCIGCAFALSGSLWVAIIAHSSINVLAATAHWIDVKYPDREGALAKTETPAA